jgi:hypothetical protein
MMGSIICPLIRGIKSRRFRWAGHVERMEKLRIAYKILI